VVCQPDEIPGQLKAAGCCQRSVSLFRLFLIVEWLSKADRSRTACRRGELGWVSGPLPGAVHDLTTARIWGIIRQLAAAGLITLADKGYHGVGAPFLTPYRRRNKPASQKEANRTHAQLRSPGERANAQLKTCTSCASSAAAPGRPGSWPKPSTSSRPARSPDETG